MILVDSADPTLQRSFFKQWTGAANLVLPAFHAPFGDWHLVDSGPVVSAFLPLLQPVADNHRAAIVSGRLPG